MLMQALFLVLTVAAIFYFRGFKRKNLPPGPRFTLPIVGHLPFLGQQPQRTFMKLSERYGPIFTIQMGSYPCVIVNDAALIRKAFNSNAFAGRPHMKYFDEISKRKGVLLSDGPQTMEIRKYLQKQLKDYGVGSSSNLCPILNEIPALLEMFEAHLSKPLDVKHAFYNTMLNALWSVVGGEHFDKNTGEFRKLATNISIFAEMKTALEKGAVFIKPIQDWLPEYSGYKRKVGGFIELRKYVDCRIKEHECTKVSGQPRDLIDTFLDKVEQTTDPNSGFYPANEQITVSMLDLFAAGVETPTTTLEWVIFYLTKYPRAQEKVQREIDGVLGSKCFPSAEDRAKLPYVEAMLDEVARLATIVPLSMFHSVLEDAELNGYDIPKDMVLVGNLFAVHHDKNIWGDPEAFRPERFIDSEGNFVRSPDVMPFSYGNRACIGNLFARMELFVFSVCIFQRFTLKPVGTLPPESGQYGITRSPHPFQVQVIKR